MAGISGAAYYVLTPDYHGKPRRKLQNSPQNSGNLILPGEVEKLVKCCIKLGSEINTFKFNFLKETYVLISSPFWTFCPDVQRHDVDFYKYCVKLTNFNCNQSTANVR